jgi:formylglycine-generating enzyme
VRVRNIPKSGKNGRLALPLKEYEGIMRRAGRALILALLALGIIHCGPKQAKHIEIEFVKIQGGEFEMGDRWGRGDSDERPVHLVKLKSFYLSKKEITVAQFRAFVQATGYRTDADTSGWGMAWIGDKGGIVKGANWQNPGFPQGGDHPVVMISWNDAMAFCKYTGTRLPREAEWEYAAREGRKQYQFPGGDSLTARQANFKLPGNVDPYPFTSPVGTLAATGFSLYDMAGNVAEWCSDWYDPGAYIDMVRSNPTGPTSGQYRVLRGGSFMDNRDFCRAVERSAGLPDDRVFSVGFRVAL